MIKVVDDTSINFCLQV